MTDKAVILPAVFQTGASFMANPLQSFSAGFNRNAKKDEPFGDSERQQMDELQKIVNDLNADGNFTAEVKLMLNERPVLEVKNKADGLGATFFIEFGRDDFGGGATLVLTSGAQRTPMGKKEGYSIEYENDRTSFLLALGEEVARKRDSQRMTAGAAAYVKAKASTSTP
jgi:hypothetical protein